MATPAPAPGRTPTGRPTFPGGPVPATVPESEVPATVLRLGEIEKVPLAGEGNFVWKVPLGTGHAVLKVYYGSRGLPLHLKKSFGNFITGRTSYMPRTRWRTETEVVRLWSENGFRCFRMLPQVTVPELPREGYMVYEWTPGRHFRDYFQDKAVGLEEKLATWRRWLPDWHRRHRLCVETGDPRFIHENGDVKHVMLWQGEFVYFDFEMTYRSSRARILVGREIATYMRSVGRFFGEEMYQKMLHELVTHYPDKALLHSAWDHAWDDPQPAWRAIRAFDRTFRPKHGERWSKYRVGADVKSLLDGAAKNLR